MRMPITFNHNHNEIIGSFDTNTGHCELNKTLNLKMLRLDALIQITEKEVVEDNVLAKRFKILSLALVPDDIGAEEYRDGMAKEFNRALYLNNRKDIQFEADEVKTEIKQPEVETKIIKKTEVNKREQK